MVTSQLFSSIPKSDPLNFGIGKDFKPIKVKDFLQLNKEQISHLAAVKVSSVRFDDTTPTAVREQLEAISVTCNMVAEAFDGDVEKTALWFRTKNPMLGDVSPRDMIRLRRFDRLRKFIVGAMADRVATTRRKVDPIETTA